MFGELFELFGELFELFDELFELFGELFELFELFGELFELFGELFELFGELFELFGPKIVLGQAKKCCICTEYVWARRKNTKIAPSTFWATRKMQFLQKFSIRIYTSKSIGSKGIFTASMVLLQNCFGPGEKVLYLH